ncbi:MAG: cytochrome c, partial [bacterium]|nr:cytochrome c [bacterium]
MKNRAGAWQLVLLLAILFPASLGAQEAADFFRDNCVSCHTIGGGRLTGPDLKDVAQRKDREWLTRFIIDPRAVIDSGDPYAQELFQQARGTVMPAVPGMTEERAAALLDLIEAESKLEESQFKGLQITDRPFTAPEIEQGRQIFLGNRRLAGGGPACISCHTMKGLGGLSGGRLGPDLSRVYERLQGRQSLGAWLFAPATTTM